MLKIYIIAIWSVFMVNKSVCFMDFLKVEVQCKIKLNRDIYASLHPNYIYEA